MPDLSVPLLSKCKGCRLRKQNYFCNLPAEALAELDRITELRTFAPGEMLFSEGDRLDELMIVCDGTAALTLASSVGNSMMLGVSERGEVLGLSSALTGHRHRKYRA